ncbi:MAG: hypothetical protein VR70_08160 [Rhodospirillaceae bacterium BRH_c57]|nr:MAG: hypothetical protein VR70_08160 [Rhodospirillaceae bacterium BRH_c57]
MRHFTTEQADHLLRIIYAALIRHDCGTVTVVTAARAPDEQDRVCFSASNGKTWPIEIRIDERAAELHVYDETSDGVLGDLAHSFVFQRYGGTIDVGHVADIVDGLLSFIKPALDEKSTLGSEKRSGPRQGEDAQPRPKFAGDREALPPRCT